MKYSLKNHAKFLNSVQKANAIHCLDLSGLERNTQSFTGGADPKWKPDAKIEAVVTTLLTANVSVKVCGISSFPSIQCSNFLNVF